MRREGRQHGMVRTCRVLPSPWNPRPHARILNKIDAPPTSGFFTKVSKKPTNHSKCGKPCKKTCKNPCTECYYYHSYNKGTQKLISRDSISVSNHKSLTWRVVYGRPGGNYSGFSATGILNDLDNQYVDEEEEEEDDDDNVDDVDDEYDGQRHDLSMEQFWPQPRRDEIVEVAEVEEEGNIMSFFDVGMMFDPIEGDEGWYVVGDVIAD